MTTKRFPSHARRTVRTRAFQSAPADAPQTSGADPDPTLNLRRGTRRSLGNELEARALRRCGQNTGSTHDVVLQIGADSLSSAKRAILRTRS